MVAQYKPDPASVQNRTHGKNMGLVHRGKYVSVASKEPIRCFEDKHCLEYILSDDSEREDSNQESAIWREKSRNFGRDSRLTVENNRREDDMETILA